VQFPNRPTDHHSGTVVKVRAADCRCGWRGARCGVDISGL